MDWTWYTGWGCGLGYYNPLIAHDECVIMKLQHVMQPVSIDVKNCKIYYITIIIYSILDVRSLAIASRASQFPSGALSCRVMHERIEGV